MLRPGDTVLVGVSGGPDSVALLNILNILAPIIHLKLGVAHLNHRLRQNASARDAEFAAAQANALGIPFFQEQTDVRDYALRKRLSVEEAGREVRYAFLYNAAETHGYNRIALGHHSDDNAELVLMFILRGSGPLGISGIPPVRDDTIIRPLIELKRSDIMIFLNASGIPFVSDRSNTDTRHLRNKIRLQLMPALKASYNPKAVETLNKLSRIVRDEDQWMEAMIDPVFENAVVVKSRDRLVLSATPLRKAHPAVTRRIMRKAVAAVKGNLRRISFSHIESALGLLHLPSNGRSLHFPDGISLECDGGNVIIDRTNHPLRSLRGKKTRRGIPDFEYHVSDPGTVFIKEIEARLTLTLLSKKNTPVSYGRDGNIAYFDVKYADFPMILRNFRPGDRFQPLGMTGTQKVKDFFINNKIAWRERSEIPILLSQGKIVWIAGHRTDETAKVTPSTVDVLKAELLLA